MSHPRVILVALAALLVAATPSGGSFGFDEQLVIRGAEPGTVLGSTATPEALVGLTCTVEFSTANNRSTHTTDVEVRTGQDAFALTDVETGDGQEISAAGPLLLGETVEVVLTRTSGTTSISFAVTVVCDPPEPEPEPEPEPLPEPDPEPTPLPEIGPDPERDCADGPDPDSDEFADAAEWREWYEANCVPADHEDPTPVPSPGPELTPDPTPIPDPGPTLPDTGIPALGLALAGLIALGAGTAALRR